MLTRRGGEEDDWYELHPFPDSAVYATEILGQMFKNTFTRSPPQRAVNLFRLVLTCSGHVDYRVRQAALHVLCRVRANVRCVVPRRDRDSAVSQ